MANGAHMRTTESVLTISGCNFHSPNSESATAWYYVFMLL